MCSLFTVAMRLHSASIEKIRKAKTEDQSLTQREVPVEGLGFTKP